MDQMLHKLTGLDGVLLVYSDRIEVKRETVIVIPLSDIDHVEYLDNALKISHLEQPLVFEVSAEKAKLAKKIVGTVRSLKSGVQLAGSPSKGLKLSLAVGVVIIIGFAMWWALSPSEYSHPEPALLMTAYLDGWMAQDWESMAAVPYGNFNAPKYKELLGTLHLSEWSIEYDDDRDFCYFRLQLTVNDSPYTTTAKMHYYSGQWDIVEFEWDDSWL